MFTKKTTYYNFLVFFNDGTNMVIMATAYRYSGEYAYKNSDGNTVKVQNTAEFLSNDLVIATVKDIHYIVAKNFIYADRVKNYTI